MKACLDSRLSFLGLIVIQILSEKISCKKEARFHSEAGSLRNYKYVLTINFRTFRNLQDHLVNTALLPDFDLFLLQLVQQLALLLAEPPLLFVP